MKFHQCNIWKNRKIFQHTNRTTIDSFFLFYLIDYLQPDRVLEIGVSEGWSVGLYLDAARNSIIDGVDINFDQIKLSTVFSSLEKFTAIKDNSKRINFEHQYNFINIDGNHSYEFAVNDIEKARTHLAPNGVIMIDDISHPGVVRASKEFILSGKLEPIFQTVQSLYCIKPGQNVLLTPYFIDMENKTNKFVRWQRTDLVDHSITSIDVDQVWTEHPDLFDQLLKTYDL